MNCPIKLDPIHCQNCAFEKEGFCDYPYRKDASLKEIKRITQEVNNAKK